MEFILAFHLVATLFVSLMIATNVVIHEERFFKGKHILVYVIFPFSVIMTGFICLLLLTLRWVADWIID